MKKFTKIMLIIAVSLLGAGLIFCGVSTAMGASVWRMAKNGELRYGNWHIGPVGLYYSSADGDDEEDDDEEEDDYEPEPRCRPVREQAERRTSSAPAKRRWKIILEDVDQQDQYSFIFMIRWESEGSVHRQSMTSFCPCRKI